MRRRSGSACCWKPPRDLVSTKLTSVGQVLVLPRARARGGGACASPSSRASPRPPARGARPQERALAFALRERGIEPIVGAVGRGWELTVKLVELGFGLGVVNAFCDVPRALVKRPLPELRSVPYHVFTRPDARANAKALERALVAATA